MSTTRHLSVFALAVTSWLLQMNVADQVLWTRVAAFDDIIIVTNYPHTEMTRVRSAGHCACLCTSNSSCSSFFFLPTTGRCLMYEFLFGKNEAEVSSPGAVYFRALHGDCPAGEGYVWIRSQRTCLKVYLSLSTFYEAYSNCTSARSQLISLDTYSKNFVVSLFTFMEYDPTLPIFLGAARDGVVNRTKTTFSSTLDPFRWMTGQLVAMSEVNSCWSSGNPSNMLGREGCLKLWKSKVWNDLECETPRFFMCELIAG